MSQSQPATPPRPHPLLVAGCAAWIHQPGEAARLNIGVVLCPALGRDERCTHRPVRLFAERLAALGFVVLRFDLPGLGDSPALAQGVDAVPMWISAAKTAGARLKRDFGVKKTAFAGVRFGATLACLAAGSGDLLVLMAPIPNGRAWLSRAAFSAGRGRIRSPGYADGLDAEGVVLSAATCDSLAALDLATDARPLPDTLFAASGRAADGLAASLEARCAAFERVGFPGYEALFLDPNDNEAPEELFSDLAQRLLRRARPLDVTPSPVLKPPTLLEDAWREQWVRFGPDLEGNLTEPVAARLEPAQGVVFLNPGGDPRAGIGRFATDACRSFAAEGFTCLRFDFSGIGDSPEPKGVRRVHVYETPRAAEIDAAVRLLKARGVEHISVVGISAGGYHALQATLTHPSVAAGFCVSTLKLVWRPGDLLSIGAPRWGRRTSAYVVALFKPSTWTRAARGQVQIGAVLSTLAGRLKSALKPESVSRESRDLFRRIRAASARGARIHFLIGTEDAALEEIEAHFGRGGSRFTRLAGMSLTLLSGLDHGLVYRRSREMATAELLRWLKEGLAEGGATLSSAAPAGARRAPTPLRRLRASSADAGR